MTRFAVCFLLVFGQLAFGGLLAIALPPFFKVERGFYRSSAAVYLSAALLTAIGFGFLAYGGTRPGAPAGSSLWIVTIVWILFCIAVSVYLVTLYIELDYLRARVYSLGLAIGLVGVLAGSFVLEPTGFGIIVAIGYAATAILSSLMLGFASAAMLFGHWYLIDPNLPVDYLRTMVRFLGWALILDLGALLLIAATLALFGSSGASLALKNLFASDWVLLLMRMLLGPVASLALTWMTWQTLKIPQTMAATGLLYIAVMSVLVGEFLGRFILFRTALPL
ncbi:MAG TPA: hypothetical protein VMB26_05990 [Candidatus Binataceae bacterium]|nr:hypothetical protein [Candidatus Binataceae bacterium]